METKPIRQITLKMDEELHFNIEKESKDSERNINETIRYILKKYFRESYGTNWIKK